MSGIKAVCRIAGQSSLAADCLADLLACNWLTHAQSLDLRVEAATTAIQGGNNAAESTIDSMTACVASLLDDPTAYSSFTAYVALRAIADGGLESKIPRSKELVQMLCAGLDIPVREDLQVTLQAAKSALAK